MIFLVFFGGSRLMSKVASRAVKSSGMWPTPMALPKEGPCRTLALIKAHNNKDLRGSNPTAARPPMLACGIACPTTGQPDGRELTGVSTPMRHCEREIG